MAIKRQQIVDAIEARLQGILTTEGYHTNLGNHVIVSRPLSVNADGSIGRAPVAPSECPCVLLRDPLDTIVTRDLDGNEEHALDVEWEIRHEGGAPTDEDLRKMEQDVRKAIGVDPTWGGLCDKGTVLQTSEKNLLKAEVIIGGVLIRGQVTYETAGFAEE